MAQKPEFADVEFKVYEFGESEPYIGTRENGPDTNTILNSRASFLMLLKPGTSVNEAEQLAQHLNNSVQRISLQF
jgi:hypothetical protein